MLVSCTDCAARGPACADCVMGSVLGPGSGSAEFGPGELTALDALADAGCVPRLRWLPPRTGVDVVNITRLPGNVFMLPDKVGAIAG